MIKSSLLTSRSCLVTTVGLIVLANYLVFVYLNWIGQVVNNNFIEGRNIVIDVGPEDSLVTRVIEYLGRLVTATKWSCPELSIRTDQSIILVRPKITQVTSFNFTARKDLKWFAIIEGYLATFEVLKELGCLAGNPVEADSEWIVATIYSEDKHQLYPNNQSTVHESSKFPTCQAGRL